MNIRILEAHEHMAGYAMFMKDLVMSEMDMGFEDVSGLHHYSAFTYRSLDQMNGYI